MPRMDGTGPEKSGKKTGRILGNCIIETEKDVNLFGVGLGKRLHSGGGLGKGKRLKYDLEK